MKSSLNAQRSGISKSSRLQTSSVFSLTSNDLPEIPDLPAIEKSPAQKKTIASGLATTE